MGGVFSEGLISGTCILTFTVINGVPELSATIILTCLVTRFDQIAVIYRQIQGNGNGLFQDRRVDCDSNSFSEPELHLSSGMSSAGPGTFLETRLTADRNIVGSGNEDAS